MDYEVEVLENKKYIEQVEDKSLIYLGIKRLFDIICSLLGCILLLPITLFVKLSYLLHKDFNSIFYNQERIGLNGKTFKLYKFRTMVPNADEELKQLLKNPEYRKEWNTNQKLNNDPRITKAGKFLRKTSLDELPQMFNILLGDMSLIGPRPLVKNELVSHKGNAYIYESVKPGVTGWWACNGRSATTYDKRLKLEYYYVLNASFLLDINCILRTIKIVLNRSGAK